MRRMLRNQRMPVSGHNPLAWIAASVFALCLKTAVASAPHAAVIELIASRQISWDEDTIYGNGVMVKTFTCHGVQCDATFEVELQRDGESFFFQKRLIDLQVDGATVTDAQVAAFASAEEASREQRRLRESHHREPGLTLERRIINTPGFSAIEEIGGAPDDFLRYLASENKSLKLLGRHVAYENYNARHIRALGRTQTANLLAAQYYSDLLVTTTGEVVRSGQAIGTARIEQGSNTLSRMFVFPSGYTLEYINIYSDDFSDSRQVQIIQDGSLLNKKEVIMDVLEFGEEARARFRPWDSLQTSWLIPAHS